MLTVIDTSENGPAYVISTFDGNAHVIPRCMFQRLVSGELEISDIDDREEILRKVVFEWMAYVDAKMNPYDVGVG